MIDVLGDAVRGKLPPSECVCCDTTAVVWKLFVVTAVTLFECVVDKISTVLLDVFVSDSTISTSEYDIVVVNDVNVSLALGCIILKLVDAVKVSLCSNLVVGFVAIVVAVASKVGVAWDSVELALEIIPKTMVVESRL